MNRYIRDMAVSVTSSTSTDALFGPGLPDEHYQESLPPPTREQSLKYLSRCIELSKQAPPRRLYLRSGCVMASQLPNGQLRLEAEGYTHKHIDDIEDAFDYYLTHHTQHNPYDSLAESMADQLPPNIIIYTSVEPCIARSDMRVPGVDHIIEAFHAGADIRKVIFGAWDPGKGNAHQILENAGIDWEYIPDYAVTIRKIAMSLRQDMDISTWLADRAWISSGVDIVDVRKVKKDAEAVDKMVHNRKMLVQDELQNPNGVKPKSVADVHSKWPEYKSGLPHRSTFDTRTRMLI